jgi:GNAT superfamily N-acetyltransferase
MTAMVHRIDSPRPEEAAAIARVHLTAWLETYPNQHAGIDEAWIRAELGSVVSPEGIARWRAVIEESRDRTDRMLCRTVRGEAGVVGFVCGRRDDNTVTLGPMYLLREARRLGLGGRLMGEFAAWAGQAPVRLWVTAYNDGAIRFYARHGFRPTGERQLWRGRLPNLRMERGAGDDGGGPTAG